MVANRKKRIVIVDDNASYLSVVRVLLKPFYDVYPAPSASKLFDIIKKFIPDLILLDVSMPEINGFEAIGILRENPGHKDIPVIFLTANDDEDGAAQGLELGAADYVTKPIYGPLLLKRISNILLVEQLKRDLHASNVTINTLSEKLEQAETV